MKKRSLVAIMMASALMLALMGCGNGAAEATPETTGETATESGVNTETEDTATEIAQADPSFEYKGKTVSFTDDVQTVVDAIKSVAEEVNEVDSADNDGKTYEFDKAVEGPGLIIVTSVDGGTESIGSMVVNGDGFKTSKGIGIGSKVSDVTAAYGEPNGKEKLSSEEKYTYKCDGFGFSFSIKGGKVYNIIYDNVK